MAGGRGGAVGVRPEDARAAEVRPAGRSAPRREGECLGRAPRTYDLPFTEWGLKQWKEYDPVKNGDYAGSCLPFGMSRSINSPHGTQIIHHPDALAFLFEQNTWHHWVPLRADFKWPADLPESWNGMSKGRWDGDTLIIETTNFNGYTKLDTAGHPHSKQLKLTNTFRRARCQHHGAHGDGARPEGVHSGLDECPDLADQAGAGRPHGILVRGEQPRESLHRARSRRGSGRRPWTNAGGSNETDGFVLIRRRRASPWRFPPIAHHSISAEFDVNKPVKFSGTIKKVDWANPHIYTHVEVKERREDDHLQGRGWPAECALSSGLAQGHAEDRRNRQRHRREGQESDVDERRPGDHHDRGRPASLRRRGESRRHRRERRQPRAAVDVTTKARRSTKITKSEFVSSWPSCASRFVTVTLTTGTRPPGSGPRSSAAPSPTRTARHPVRVGPSLPALQTAVTRGSSPALRSPAPASARP